MRAEIKYHDNQLVLTGEMTFSSVMTLWERSLPLLKKFRCYQFNLSDVKHVDSASIALLLEWINHAHKNQQSIHFLHMPHQLQEIIHASGLASLFEINRS